MKLLFFPSIVISLLIMQFQTIASFVPHNKKVIKTSKTFAWVPSLSEGLVILASSAILLSVVGQRNLEKKVEDSMASIDKKFEGLETKYDISNSKIDDLRSNFNYLYGGFAISVALLAGFNSVSDAFKNIATIQEQTAEAEQLRLSNAKEKKDSKYKEDFEKFIRQKEGQTTATEELKIK